MNHYSRMCGEKLSHKKRFIIRMNQHQNHLSVDDLLAQEGFTIDDLAEESRKPQPATLSLEAYNDLVNSFSNTHPSFSFNAKTRNTRVIKRDLLPKQIQKAKASIRAWEREIQAMSTCEKADQVLASAEAEMKLVTRMDTAGVLNCEVTHTHTHTHTQPIG